jgi:ammonia channel protein AmtB
MFVRLHQKRTEKRMKMDKKGQIDGNLSPLALGIFLVLFGWLFMFNPESGDMGEALVILGVIVLGIFEAIHLYDYVTWHKKRRR